MLLVAQPIAIGLLVVAALELLGGSNWIVLLPAIAALLVTWVGQAVHAHQRAIALGGAPGGELQVAWLLPGVLAVVTVFWLLGGHHGSVAATVGEYVSAWQTGRATAAAQLFSAPTTAEELDAMWLAHRRYLEGEITSAGALYGPASGLDPEVPFSALRFSEPARSGDGETAVVDVDIVRHQRVETMLFGVIPTASQTTLVVERAGTIDLRSRPAPAPAWLPAPVSPGDVWLIERVRMP